MVPGRLRSRRRSKKKLGTSVLVHLKADDRTHALLPLCPDKLLREINLMAAQQIDAKLAECIRAGRSFLVETVLSTEKYRNDLHEAKPRGFRYGFVCVSIEPAGLSPARVNLRVMKRGHDVDPVKVVERWHKSHDLSLCFAA